MDQEKLAFERLHRLARKGYVAELGGDPEAGILLHHPGGAPALMLHPEGEVESLEAPASRRRGPVAIPPEDEAAFYRFLERVPDAGPRKRGFWRKFLWIMLFLGIWFFSLMLTIAFLVD